MKRQPYAVFDIDGTIFRSSLLLEITYRAIANGVLPKNLSIELAKYRDPWLNRKHDETYQRYILKIVDDQMILSEIGILVQQYWNAIPTHFPFVELGEFIVMPNHVHGIIIIDKPGDGRFNKMQIIC